MLKRSAVIATLLALGGCGTKNQPVDQSKPLPIGKQVQTSASAPRVTAVSLRRPIRTYKAYVGRQLARVAADVHELRTALAAGRTAQARAAWRRANAGYQTIGAAYGAFGDYDAAINASPAGLQRGVRDPHFKGLQRVELALFGRRRLADAQRPAAALERSVARLRQALPGLSIDPLEYVIRAHEIIEGTLNLVLTGRDSAWSGSTYEVVAANVRGTRFVVGTVAALLRDRLPSVVARVRRDLNAIDRTLKTVRGRGGSYRPLGAVTQKTRERIAQLVAATAEELSLIPEALDPRPPRPARPAFGAAG